jgi:hypothetical protein
MERIPFQNTALQSACTSSATIKRPSTAASDDSSIGAAPKRSKTAVHDAQLGPAQHASALIAGPSYPQSNMQAQDSMKTAPSGDIMQHHYYPSSETTQQHARHKQQHAQKHEHQREVMNLISDDEDVVVVQVNDDHDVAATAGLEHSIDDACWKDVVCSRMWSARGLPKP